MGSAAQRNDMAGLFDYPAGATESATELKEAVAARLAAHRRRSTGSRAASILEAAGEGTERSVGRQGAARVREAVAARFQQSVSYREYLAAEAERALQQAEAEAEIAARKVRAVAEAQLELLQELDQWKEAEAGPREAALQEQRAEARGELAHALADIALGARELIAEPIFVQPVAHAAAPVAHIATGAEAMPANQIVAGNLTVRLFEEIGTSRVKPGDLRMGKTAAQSPIGEFELSDLEQEIEFRRAPEFQPHVIETTPIPANLIEFPRQLIAPRKARPRLAEGPLREDSVPEPQLRIFEVEPEQISVEATATAPEPAAIAEWQTLLLEGGAVRAPAAPAQAQVHFTLQPQTASLELRLMAAAVDGSCLLATFLLFAAVVVELCGMSLRGMPKPLLGASAAGVLSLLFVAYQLLFFSFAEATPGMRYARIGLCTFADTNPSRRQMRRRILATLLAACPLALGLLWVFLDDERLGWHDRMSKMYQRAY